MGKPIRVDAPPFPSHPFDVVGVDGKVHRRPPASARKELSERSWVLQLGLLESASEGGSSFARLPGEDQRAMLHAARIVSTAVLSETQSVDLAIAAQEQVLTAGDITPEGTDG